MAFDVDGLDVGSTELILAHSPRVDERLRLRLDLDFLRDMPNIKSVLFVSSLGTYYVTAGANAHTAENNVLAARGVAAGTETGGNTALVNTYVPDNGDVDATTYATDSKTGVAFVIDAHGWPDLYLGQRDQRHRRQR